jgi:hypothetical protein
MVVTAERAGTSSGLTGYGGGAREIVSDFLDKGHPASQNEERVPGFAARQLRAWLIVNCARMGLGVNRQEKSIALSVSCRNICFGLPMILLLIAGERAKELREYALK